MAFFDLCHKDEFSASLVYEEIPGYYTFNIQNGTFQQRRRELWNKFKDHFMEDYIRDFQRHYPEADINAQLENFSNLVLFALQDVLLSIGSNTFPHYDLPSPQAIDGIVENLNREYFEQSNSDPVELQQNRRAHSADSEFSKILLDVGEGKCPEVNSTHDIELPTGLCQVISDTETLIHSIYDVHNLNIKEDSWLCESSILAPINDQITVLNQLMLDKIPGKSQTYLSTNTVCNPDEAVNYPREFLSSISVPGLPPHKLELKIGVPFILLRNLNPPKLCNGTRQRVVSLQKNVIEGRVISECGKGEIVYIP
ncbi:ATP-dependent DNA helicase [Trichonephila inaurata madagascariensis]|uniref:ATP-dependent DNA helicase n=1 Tax=Trichonephila inaurata madagascariensis TaxID=2747483 RepID=A0A8X6WU29_9ARAC|nr:ATP-dependent DNA helicase [Trichonephila inaurata madagascariensis]